MNTDPQHTPEEAGPLLIIRGLVGGLLMGLANLVPGISGGTMLVAAGVYQKFINAIAELTTFKFRKVSILTLGSVGVAAAAAIVLLAGPVKSLVVDHRWVMYSLFIGLTLGGVPVIWGMIKKPSSGVFIAAFVGLVAMVGLAFAQSGSTCPEASRQGLVMMFIAGVAGASAMILPGISGGYLLLLLGVYVPILEAIDALKVAAKAGELSSAMGPITEVVIPVGVGVVVGVVVVSNVLKRLLDHFEGPTLGSLLGLLVGAVAGLWPFQMGIKPVMGGEYCGKPVTAELLEGLKPSKWPVEFYTPETTQILSALGLIVAGFVCTALIARLGKAKG